MIKDKFSHSLSRHIKQSKHESTLFQNDLQNSQHSTKDTGEGSRSLKMPNTWFTFGAVISTFHIYPQNITWIEKYQKQINQYFKHVFKDSNIWGGNSLKKFNSNWKWKFAFWLIFWNISPCPRSPIEAILSQSCLWLGWLIGQTPTPVHISGQRKATSFQKENC